MRRNNIEKKITKKVAETRKLTADLDGRLKKEEVRLREEDFLGGDAEVADLRLGQLHLLPLALHQSLYDVVDVGVVEYARRRI